jgi:hypothetical protein
LLHVGLWLVSGVIAHPFWLYVLDYSCWFIT